MQSHIHLKNILRDKNGCLYIQQYVVALHLEEFAGDALFGPILQLYRDTFSDAFSYSEFDSKVQLET